MKKNYNPFTVPDNYFENVCDEAVRKYRKRRRSIRCGIATVVVAAVLLVVPVFIQSLNDNQNVPEMTNNLAEMYEYDIFLQVNF